MEKTRIFDDRTLSFDTTSAANPDEYRRKPYITTNDRPWATSLPLTAYAGFNPSRQRGGGKYSQCSFSQK